MGKLIKRLFFCIFLLGCLFVGFSIYVHHQAINTQELCKELLSDFSDSPENPNMSGNPELIENLRNTFGNPDIIGLLEFPELGYTYPVVQGRNNEYYLSHNVYGDWDPNGTIFLDISCESDFSGSTAVLYGHKMDDGSMFGWIEKYYMNSGITDKTFRLYLEDRTISYNILSATRPEAYGEQIYLLDEGESMDEFQETLKEQSILWNEDVSCSDTKQALSLMTCHGNGRYYRFGITGIETK